MVSVYYTSNGEQCVRLATWAASCRVTYGFAVATKISVGQINKCRFAHDSHLTRVSDRTLTRDEEVARLTIQSCVAETGGAGKRQDAPISAFSLSLEDVGICQAGSLGYFNRL